MKLFLLIIILFTVYHSYSQEVPRNNDSVFFYKNAVKGFIILVPVTGIFANFSIGYERYISKQNALELGGFYLFRTDEMGLQYHTICIMPAYKYFVYLKKKGVESIWLSGYLSYLFETHTHTDTGDHTRHNLYYYGIGGSIGKKFHLFKEKKWFIDIGFGISYNFFDDKPMFSNNDWSNRIFPRPILQFGGKF